MDAIVSYIEAGAIDPETPQALRKLAFCHLCFPVLGVVPGLVLKGVWMVIFTFMLLLSITCWLFGLIISTKELSTKNILLARGVNCLNLCLQCLLLMTIVYLDDYGFDMFLILLYLPSILMPVGLGFINSKILKKGVSVANKKTNDQKETKTNGQKALICGGWTGLLGVNLAKHLFSNTSQETALVIIIVILSIVSLATSFGLLNFQRLYYLKKIEN